VCPVALAKGYYVFMHYVYVLKLIDGSIYIGSASNIKKRLIDHKHGLVSSTKNKLPVTVKFFGAVPNKVLAMRLEKYLKSGSGFSWRKRHLEL
jgi:putative endonuclease